jgi:hypothetical protein
MATLSVACPPPVASLDVTALANRILTAWVEGQDGVLRHELTTASMQGIDAEGLDFTEQERMEVLQSVVESLQQKQTLSRAGLRLLKHLAVPSLDS